LSHVVVCAAGSRCSDTKYRKGRVKTNVSSSSSPASEHTSIGRAGKQLTHREERKKKEEGFVVSCKHVCFKSTQPEKSEEAKKTNRALVMARRLSPTQHTMQRETKKKRERSTIAIQQHDTKRKQKKEKGTV
jgi:hypothetical protein